jgi:hypothetical protein
VAAEKAEKVCEVMRRSGGESGVAVWCARYSTGARRVVIEVAGMGCHCDVVISVGEYKRTCQSGWTHTVSAWDKIVRETGGIVIMGDVTYIDIVCVPW